MNSLSLKIGRQVVDTRGDIAEQNLGLEPKRLL